MRHTDWPMRLNTFIAERERRPFAWGKNDCCMFTADWLLALTGEDPASELRGTYDSALSAARILDELGGVSGIIEAAAAERGWECVPVSMARRGDIVEANMDGWTTAGVCVGEQSAFSGKQGTKWLIYWPTLECVRAWRVE